MPFQVRNEYLPAAISDSHINQIAHSDTSPDVSVWEKIKPFFCSTKKPEARELIRQICHPSAGSTREQVANRFEQLRTLAYSGFEENVQFGRHGENHFCILDENSREMLSVTLDDAGKYTVKCQGHSETHHLPSPPTAEEYEAVWSAWERAAPAGESPLRATAVQKMRDCLKNGRTEIDLSYCGLTTLPDLLPHNLTALNTDGILLKSLPPLPSGLQALWCANNWLTSLPALPERLQQLVCSKNQLTSLPALPALPERLQILECAKNCLFSLPELPEGLQQLECSDNWLTRLPALPKGLQLLDVDDNQLTRLPELPKGLQQLRCSNNQLTSLPPLPEGLQLLDVDDNQLSSLPENIDRLPADAIVTLSDNLLSEPTLQALAATARAPGYSGPRIYFNMAGPSAPREARPLHLAVAAWLMPATEGEPAPADSWQSSGQESDAASFSAFLDKLRLTKNCQKDPGFKAQISSWLTQLAKDDELRAKTFAMATEAASSCEDRATLALNQMKNVQLLHDAEKGKYDNNLPGLISTGREMFRLERLEQIARDKVKELRLLDENDENDEIDEIEVYLAYQNKLKESLELSSVTTEMLFFDISGVTDSDLQEAEVQVKTAENSQFREWILLWAPLRSMLECAYREEWEALTEKKISDYEDAYRTLSETELKPATLTGNADAVRTIGTKAMAIAVQAFQEGLRPLADRMLGGHLQDRWS